jgi:predicted metal-dependent hydrolase
MVTKLKISNLQIETIRKDIKNIHLGVYPPDGRVRVSVPLSTSDDSLRIFLISKSSWIKKQKTQFSKQERQTKREYVSGESHFFLGRKYQLTVKKTDETLRIHLKNKTKIELFVNSKTTLTQKQKIFEQFYRDELESLIPKLIQKWEKKVGVKTKEVRIKKMKTKWGTCNQKDKRIWLNLELAKQPLYCIDYVFVHELVHLKERRHNERFLNLLTDAYPKWRHSKDELNHGILSYFEWGCKSNPKLKDVIKNV